MSGLPLILYKRNRPNQKGGFRGTSKTLCPDMEACRAAVRAVAPVDYLMWEKYSTAFEAKVAALQKEGADLSADAKGCDPLRSASNVEAVSPSCSTS